MCNINWPETYSMFTGIGSLVMALAVSAAAWIAIKTLNVSRDIRRQDLSTKLLDIWQKNEYSKKYTKLQDFYDLKSENLKNYYKTEEKTPIDFTPFDEKFMEVLNTLISLKNFILKLNYYLDKKKLVIENIDIDFSSRLVLNTEKSMKKLYEVLRWSYEYINFASLITLKDKNILNNFYIRVSKYKKYNDLVEYIIENNKKLKH